MGYVSSIVNVIMNNVDDGESDNCLRLFLAALVFTVSVGECVLELDFDAKLSWIDPGIDNLLQVVSQSSHGYLTSTNPFPLNAVCTLFSLVNVKWQVT